VHGAFEELYEGLQAGRKPTLDGTLERFEALWREGWTPDVKLRPGSSTEEWLEVGRQCVRGYYEARAPFDSDRTVAVEKKIGFALEAAGEPMKIEGYIDRLALARDGAFEIHDYKTSKNLPTQADVDADRQLAIYDVAVREAWPDTREVRLVWHYLRHGKTLVSTRTDEQRGALRAELSALIEKIKRDHEFAPRESALCGWCEYRDLCPLFKHGESLAALPPQILSADAGAKLVEELAVLDAKRRELKDELKAVEVEVAEAERSLLRYADAQELSRVVGPSGEALVTRKEELKLPTKTASPREHAELEAALKALPIWPEVSHLDAHGLVNAARAKAWPASVQAAVDALLEKYGHAATTEHVRFKKRKDDDAE
jgi:RecB family exonuclease